MDAHHVTQERSCYSDLCLSSRDRGRQLLEAELDQLDRRFNDIRRDLSQLIYAFQMRPGNWLQRWLRPRALEQRAAAEFDALAGAPAVAALDCDRASQQMLITTWPQAAGTATPRLTLALRDGQLTIDPAPARAVRLALAAAAAPLIAAGELTRLVALVAGPVNPTSPAPSQISPRARPAYIQCRAALLRADQTDEPQREAEVRLAALMNAMAGLVRRACMAERALDDMQAATRQAAETYGREFDLLRGLPGVQAISIADQRIYVQTEPIALSVGGAHYRIGRFRIAIDPGKQIEIRNQDQTIDGRYDHPHIRNGQPCWGNSQAFFAAQLAGHNFAAIVQQAIEFLHSYNPGSAFAQPESWSAGT
jgi:hypothetical protein